MTDRTVVLVLAGWPVVSVIASLLIGAALGALDHTKKDQ